MTRFRISLFGLFGAVSLVAVFLGIVVNANEILLIAVWSTTSLLLICAGAYAVVASGRRRVVVTAFAVCTWSYLAIHYAVGHTQEHSRTLITTQLLFLIWDAIKTETGVSPYQGGVLFAPDWSYFVNVGAPLTAMLMGFTGAWFAAMYWRPESPVR